MKKLFVRVHPKSAAQKFIRCGTTFTQEWKTVTVDAATAARLQAEQMLEVRDTDPNAPAKAQELPTVKELVAEAAAALLGKSPPEPTVVEPLAQSEPVLATTGATPVQADTAEPVQADPVPVAAPAQADPAPVDTPVNAVVEAKPKKGSK